MNYFATMDSPIGPLRTVVDERGAVVQILFEAEEMPDAVPDETKNQYVLGQLRAYFRGELKVFDLELAPAGSEFQRTVWKIVHDIPFGVTRSYGQIAAELNLPSGARAVGRANATNPIPIVVPCHRVIGANGSLTGYAGGLEVKRQLLEFEQPGLFG